MSSLKQEVAAILMDYTDKIPEQVYMDILNKLGAIPDHKDPKKASEIQLELDKANRTIDTLEEENDIFREENDEMVQSLAESEKNFYNLAKFFNHIVKKIPTVHNDSILLYDLSNTSKEEVEESINSANRFIDNLNTVRRGRENYRYLYDTRWSTDDGLGETDDILPSISSLFSTSDEVEIETNDSGEDIEKEEEIVETSNEIDQSKEDNDTNKLDWRDETTLIGVAIQLEEVGNYQDAIKQYRDILQCFPKSARAYYRLALLIDSRAHNRADHDTALGYYLAASSLNPEKNYSRCYNNIGILLEIQKDAAGAEIAYRKAIQFDETHGRDCSNTHFNLADLLQKCSRNEEAIAEYLLVLKQNPEDIIARESIMKLFNIKYSNVRRRLVFATPDELENFHQLMKFNGRHLEIINNISSIACVDCLVKKIINNFNGKINNYYGTLLLHENNHKYTKSVIEKSNEKANKKTFTRDMKYSVHTKKEQEWKQTSNAFYRDVLPYQTLL